jgi:hypothetical protein
MPNTGSHRKRGDGAAKWLVGGAVATLGMGVLFLTFMAEQIRFGANGDPGPLMVITLLGAGMFAVVALGPIGKAIGKRILDGGASGDEDLLSDDMNDLRLQSDELRQTLLEMQERLDFTERMLAGGRERAPEELH